MNIGDRVIYKYYKAIIIGKASTSLPKRIFIKLINISNLEGSEVKTWVCVDELKIDVAYYRNIKINKLLND